jgi:hypothetical protein
LFKRGTAAGAEARLGINCGVAAYKAYDRRRGNSRTAPVAELRQFVRHYRAAPGTNRECRLFLFGYGSAAPVAELCLVIERRVAAFTTGFCHVLPLVDKTVRSINSVMLFSFPIYPLCFKNVFLQIPFPEHLSGWFPFYPVPFIGFVSAIIGKFPDIQVHPAPEGFL